MSVADNAPDRERDEPRRQRTDQDVLGRDLAVGPGDLGKSQQTLGRGHETGGPGFAHQHQQVRSAAAPFLRSTARPRPRPEAPPSELAEVSSGPRSWQG